MSNWPPWWTATSSPTNLANCSTTRPTSTTWLGSTTWMDTASHRKTSLPWLIKTHPSLCTVTLKSHVARWLSEPRPSIDLPTWLPLQGGRQEASGCLHQRQGSSRFWNRVCSVLLWMGVRTQPDHHQENCSGHWDWLLVPGSFSNCYLSPLCQRQVGPSTGLWHRPETYFLMKDQL